MTKEHFYDDLGRVYRLERERREELHRFYDAVHDADGAKRPLLTDFLEAVGLEGNEENRMAAATRIADLKETGLVQAMKKAGFDEEAVIRGKEEAYLFVAGYYMESHNRLLSTIDGQKLLTPFYRAVLHGVHKVGRAFSGWQSSWTAQIVNGVNRELSSLFQGDEEKVFRMLSEQKLLDPTPDGKPGDRSYSVLVKTGEGFKSLAYADAFRDQVAEVTEALGHFIGKLGMLEDEIFGLQREWVAYLEAIKEALAETDTARLIGRWAEVDRKWMAVTSPIQIGHPLEYYEDRYRKAVALEWDLRIVNPERTGAEQVAGNVKAMYRTLFPEVSGRREGRALELGIGAVDRTQLYIGRPLFYYGAEFCGLFSAQVVPNDEQVSAELGKKIFAFADMVRESAMARPFLLLDREVFGGDFLAEERETLFRKPEEWHRVYNASTIGHEYGHTLWLEEDTEQAMNATGNFKNVEEFKATAGGLAAFYLEGERELKRPMLVDTVKRAVRLMAWRESEEVRPYYCEGLIHLTGMFRSGVLDFEGGVLSIDLGEEKEAGLAKWYLDIYRELASHYLRKLDATTFLERFVIREGNGVNAADPKVRAFSDHYWERYKAIGQVADKEGERPLPAL